MNPEAQNCIRKKQETKDIHNHIVIMKAIRGLIYFKDACIALNSIAGFLEEKWKCNLVICLSQLGFKNKGSMDDITLAGRSENIDVIPGGHSHTYMSTPYIVLNKQNREVIINHAGCRD